VNGADGHNVARTSRHPLRDANRQHPADIANAKRIVSCVNGCKGIKDPESVVPELVAALKGLLDQLEGVGIYIPECDEGQWAGTEGLCFAQAEQVLAKLEGDGNAGCDKCGMNDREDGSRQCRECNAEEGGAK